ncbi:MAG: asparagine synthase (glutamine-hydrolyzing) [bacterium]|nr:asparagine synthase (glutamine-hydrolyzing) [bacterium]
MGHRRLSIIDLAGGHQPMRDDLSGRVIVFNGEIYNYGELRPELKSVGSHFSSNSDTEVLLKLANFDSTGWLHRLNGMWAFALWDEKKQELMMSRDRLGIKPLYWCIADGCFLFASEIKSLLAHPAAPRNVREEAVLEYLAFRNIGGSATLLEGIHELEPGHVLRLRRSEMTPEIVRYWEDRPSGADNCDWSEFGRDQAEVLQSLLDDAVRYRLISDVPVGTYNSGGVDSSLITAAGRRQSAGELHTFYVGFSEASHDESRWARVVADRIGTHHHMLVVGASEYADALPEMVWLNDEPLHHAHTVQLRMLSRMAKEYVTVVLTGEGADELFAGYPRYQIPLLTERMSHMPTIISRTGLAFLRQIGARRLVKLLEVAGDKPRSVQENSRFATTEQLSLLGYSDMDIPARAELYTRVDRMPLNLLEKVLAFDRGSYLPSLLHRLDRTTMASGVEARVPFLDYRLLAWSKTLPSKQKMVVGSQNKVLLKALAAKSFPRAMIYRRKMGFDVPVAQWLREQHTLGRYMDLLTDQTFRNRDTIDHAAVGRMVDEHRSGRSDHSELLWPLLNLELWRRTCVENLKNAPSS